MEASAVALCQTACSRKIKTNQTNQNQYCSLVERLEVGVVEISTTFKYLKGTGEWGVSITSPFNFLTWTTEKDYRLLQTQASSSHDRSAVPALFSSSEHINEASGTCYEMVDLAN